MSAFLFLKLDGGVNVNVYVFSGGKFSCLNVALVHMSSPNAIWMSSLKPLFSWSFFSKILGEYFTS